MSQPCQVAQAYDRALIKEVPSDAAALKAKPEAAFDSCRIAFRHAD